jgi:hypothetical protein
LNNTSDSHQSIINNQLLEESLGACLQMIVNREDEEKEERDEETQSPNFDEEEFISREPPKWNWSTGACNSNDNEQKEKGKERKRLILPGEKKKIKKLHMSRLREERAEKKMMKKANDNNSINNNNLYDLWINGAREAMEQLASSTTYDNDDDAIESVEDDASDEFDEGDASDDTFLIFSNVSPRYEKLLRALAFRYKLNIDIGQKRSVIISRNLFSSVPSPTSEAFLEILDICAPTMTREEYLNDPERLAKVRKTVMTNEKNDEKQQRKSKNSSMMPSKRPIPRKPKDNCLPLSTPVDFVTSGSISGSKKEGSDDAIHSTRDKQLDEARFGTFTKHNVDISMKLMEKMGFEKGKGLGPKEDGIKTPIDVQVRKKHLGLGSSNR